MKVFLFMWVKATVLYMSNYVPQRADSRRDNFTMVSQLHLLALSQASPQPQGLNITSYNNIIIGCDSVCSVSSSV